MASYLRTLFTAFFSVMFIVKFEVKEGEMMRLCFQRRSAIHACAFKTSYRFHLCDMKQCSSHIKSQTPKSLYFLVWSSVRSCAVSTLWLWLIFRLTIRGNSEFVSVALGIQRATRVRHVVLSSVACLALPYFSTLSHIRQDFRGGSY